MTDGTGDAVRHGTVVAGGESAGARSSGTGPARDTRSGPRDRRSRGVERRISATRRHPVAARELVQGLAALGGGAEGLADDPGSTRLESSIVTVGPVGPSSMTMPDALR